MTDRLEIKAQLAVTEAGEITGIAWPFGSADRVGDVIVKGAFAAPAALPMLFAHDQAQVIGVWDRITETEAGLTVKGRLLIDDVERAREVRAMVKAEWPVDGGSGPGGDYTNEEFDHEAAVRAEIKQRKERFEQTGALIDAPPSDVIRFF